MKEEGERGRMRGIGRRGGGRRRRRTEDEGGEEDRGDERRRTKEGRKGWKKEGVVSIGEME